LLCMFNGFAMPKPFCGLMKSILTGGSVRHHQRRAERGFGRVGRFG
jgi:hypothetical protein